MLARVPRLPFSLDPLIAEAKRRARQRRLLLALSVLLLAVLAAGLASAFRSPGGGSSNGGALARANSSTRFAGFFPPVGARATLPAHGKVLLELPRGNLYADGHIITDRGVQRLTPWGARLLWSKIRTVGLAAGLFRHSLEAAVASQHHISRWYHVCSGRHMITAHVGTSARAHPRHPPTPAQLRALARIDTLFATATSLLPARAWADRAIRPYVPNHYDLSHDRYDPDPAKVPSPAREALAQYQASHFEQGIPTDQARALIAAFVKSGVKTVRDPGWGPHELSFRLPTAHGAAFGGNYTALRVFPDGPPIGDTHNYCRYPVP
jgi:hypothetical protein